VVIRQGEVYWLEHRDVLGSEQRGTRPHVVIQNDAVNRSAIRTVLVCPLTTNLRRAAGRGNVLLEAGEANLPRESVVNVSQIFAADKNRLAAKIGTLSTSRIVEIVSGINVIIVPREAEEPAI
jgi:mRNA interferase MazF